MPSLVTPARRRRTVVDENDWDDEHRENGSTRSEDDEEEERASKRARSESFGVENERIGNGVPSVSGNILFTGNHSDHTTNTSSPISHQPGAIVRVKLSNFVTYKAAEFYPGPSLNMVIGPNGTGKSTLVCAICIGLGWDPKYLGRQKEVSEFVKYGESEGFIEIELRHRPGQNRNPVIKCQVKRDANKTIYTLNGRASNKKQVRELARSFSIQIDNLCQFLPQDKVVEFAAMSPVDLLHSTQQAVGTEQIIKWHKQLTEWRQDQRKVETEMASGQETLKNLEARQKAQEADVARVREREQVKKTIGLWKTVLPIVTYYDLYEQRNEEKQRLDEAQQDLTRLQDSLEPALRAVNAKEAYRDAIASARSVRNASVEAADADCTEKASSFDKLQNQHQQLEKEFERARKETKDDRVELKRLSESLKNIESQMRNEPPHVDLGQINEQIRSKERRQIEIREDDGPAARNEWDRKKSEAAAIMNQIASRKRDIEGLDSRAGKQENKLQRLSPDTAKAWKHIREHQHLFEKPIFGPPMVECSVRDQQYVPLMEALFQRSDMLYLVAQTKPDFLKLHALVKEELKLAEVNIRTSLGSLDRFPRPQVSSQDMQRWGLDGWAINYMDGPEPVLAALCETNFLHRTAVALQDTTPAQFDQIVAGGIIQNWVTRKSYYRVIRRREYGPDATSTTVRDVRPAQVWTDQPVDPEAKVEMEREISQWKEEVDKLRESGRGLQDQLNALKAESSGLQKEVVRKAIPHRVQN
jgi:structural maintenance of chromosomes protein 5